MGFWALKALDNLFQSKPVGDKNDGAGKARVAQTTALRSVVAVVILTFTMVAGIGAMPPATNTQGTVPVAHSSSTAPRAQSWIPEKPDSIYAALVGGLIGLVAGLSGAMLTNRHALKRQQAQLTHEKDQNEKERQHALRREIYLPLAEAVSAAGMFVMQTPTLALEAFSSPENPMMKLDRQVGKLNLIASREVIEPVNVGYTSLQKCYMLVLSERYLIEKARIALSGVISSGERCRSQMDGLKQRADAAFGNATLHQNLLLEMAETGKRWEQLIQQQRLLSKKKSDMEFELLERARIEFKPLRTHALQSLLAIRHELNFSIDKRWLAEFMEANVNQLDAAAKDHGEKARLMVQQLFIEAGFPPNAEGNE